MPSSVGSRRKGPVPRSTPWLPDHWWSLTSAVAWLWTTIITITTLPKVARAQTSAPSQAPSYYPVTVPQIGPKLVGSPSVGGNQGWGVKMNFDGSVVVWGVPLSSALANINGGVFVHKRTSSGYYTQYTLPGYLSGTGSTGGSASQGRSIGMNAQGNIIAWGGPLSFVAGGTNIGGVR
jgi:hypothetical protein